MKSKYGKQGKQAQKNRNIENTQIKRKPANAKATINQAKATPSENNTCKTNRTIKRKSKSNQTHTNAREAKPAR